MAEGILIETEDFGKGVVYAWERIPCRNRDPEDCITCELLIKENADSHRFHIDECSPSECPLLR